MAARGRIEEAITHYSVALRINPDNAKAHNALGNALVSQGKLEEAIAHYSAALRINANYTEARDNQRAAQARLQQAKDKTQAGAGGTP